MVETSSRQTVGEVAKVANVGRTCVVQRVIESLLHPTKTLGGKVIVIQIEHSFSFLLHDFKTAVYLFIAYV